MLVQNDEGKVLEADTTFERAPQIITQRPLEMCLVGYALLARLGHPRADGRLNATPGLAWRIGMKRRLLRQDQRLNWKPRQGQNADYSKSTLAKPQTSLLNLTRQLRPTLR